MENQEALPLSLRLIRELHAVLMDGVRGTEQNPGRFRRVQNQIGYPAHYVPPPINYLDESLDAFEKYLHSEHCFDPLVEAFLVHYQFEAIHPFRDGNGRVGRLLLALTIAEWCNLSDQWLYMSAYFDRNKDHYTSRMFRVSTHGAWDSWIEFCLKGIIEEADDTQRRCDHLLALHRDFHQKLNAIGGSVRLSSIIDDLCDTPVAIAVEVQRKHNITYPTARQDLRKLKEAGIITELPNAPQISYYCPQIFAITYENV